VITNVVEPD